MNTSNEVKTLVELARMRAEISPQRTIYRFLDHGEHEGSAFTYAQLDLQARAIAATLQQSGLSGERILLLYPPGLDYISAFFGCLYAGAVAVPVYPPHPRRLDRLMAVAQNAEAAAAMTVSGLRSKLESALSTQPHWPSIAWFSTDTIDVNAATHWYDPAIDSDTLAFLQYTSGSTSTPKGVMLSHANLLHNEFLIHSYFESSPNSIGVGWLPLYHDMGLIGNVLQPIYSDFPMVLMSPVDFVQNPLRWLKAISKYRATISGGPNFAYEHCIRRITPEQRAALDLSSWRVAFCGAERIDAGIVDRFVRTFAPSGFREGTFFPCYGLAEASLIVTGVRVGHGSLALPFTSEKLAEGIAEPCARSQHARVLVGCGRSLSTQRVLVVDGEKRLPCKPGRIGEIWVAGPSVAQGYFGRPGQTQSTFGARLTFDITDDRPQTFLRTGDVGFFHEGELFVTGRVKDLIIVCGKNHSPEDIEREVPALHPALQNGSGAAFSVDIDGAERLVIVQEVRRKAELDIAQLSKTLKRVLNERHDLPLWAFVLIREGSIHKTTSGKIQRHAVRNAYLQGTLNVVNYFGPLPEPEDPAEMARSREG